MRPSSGRSPLLCVAFLLPGQDEQFRVCGKDVTNRVLKAFAGLNALSDVFDQRFRNMDHTPLSLRHEGQGVMQAPVPCDAVAGGFATGLRALRERSG
jgi:hypothetical protein